MTSTTLYNNPPAVNSHPRTEPFVSPSVRFDDVHQIAEALAKVMQIQRLPQAKPDVFRGDEPDTKFFIWETAFVALIDSAPISAQQKLYLLYQHLDGKAKKTVEQLQYMVSANPEIAYREARKRLKNDLDGRQLWPYKKPQIPHQPAHKCAEGRDLVSRVLESYLSS